MSKNRYVFSLLGVNIEKIDQKYGIISTLGTDNVQPINTTTLEELELNKKHPETISFLDDSKQLHRCHISFVDFSSGQALVSGKRYKCYWCRNSIPEDYRPIGCPIRYIPSRATKTYHSEINKERYSITEPITEFKNEELKKKKDKRISIEDKGYYETDGIFCSFNCCMAYIQSPEIVHNSLFRNSETLLLQMHNHFYPNEKVSAISPAQHWRTLIEYGGNCNIEQFRESFNKVEYLDFGNISFVGLGRLFEDKIKF